MPPPHLGAAAWDRQTKAVFAALCLTLAASLFWVVHPYYEANIETNDASMYILSAQALVSGRGYAYLGQPFAVRPPGMSVLLAPIVAWRGLDFGSMHLLVNLFGAAGILCLFAWMRSRVGNAVAAAFGIFVWLNPGFRHFCNQVMSDVPGLTLTIALLLLERRTDRNRSWTGDLLLGACIGVASYVRTILVLLVPAIVIARVARRLLDPGPRPPWIPFLPRGVLPLASGTVLLLLPWSLRNAAVMSQGPVDQNFIHSYSAGMFHVDPGDPASALRPITDVTDRIPDRTRRLLSLMGSRMATSQGGVWSLVAGAALVCATLAVLWRERRSAEVYFLIVAGVLLVYFGYRDRLGLPLFVLGWAAASELVSSPAGSLIPQRVRRGVLAAILLALALSGFRYQGGWKDLELQHRADLEQARAWIDLLPSDARLAAPIGWHLSVHLGRPVYSLHFAILRKGREADSLGLKGAQRNEMKGAEEVIDKYGLNTVILDGTPAGLAMLPYFQGRYGPGVRAGEGWIFRVRP